MNREIKFRVWDNVDYMSTPFTLKDLQETKIQFAEDCKIMQFTGNKGTDGKEIYEGDIVKLAQCEGEDEETSVVKFHDGGFIVEADFGDYDMTTIGWALEQCDEITVVGNIYQNPDLL